MRVSLSSPVRKTAFLGGCLFAGLLGWALCWQFAAEDWAARSGTIDGYRQAARIQPLNASNFSRMGAIYLDGGSPQEALAELKKAVEINPLSSRTWLYLATVYGGSGDTAKRRDAVMQALKTDPTDIATEWTAGTLLIQSGDVDGGLKLIGQAASSDPARVPGAMAVAYSSTGGDLDKTVATVPSTVNVRLKMVQWLIDQHLAAEADRVWPAVLTANGKLTAKDSFFYLDSLLERHQVAQAQTVWMALAGVDPEVSKRTENGSLVSNGDFEDELLNGGFDWRYTPTAGITVTIDTSIFHGGTRSLAVQFDANNVPDSGVYQLVAVEPATRYVLRGFMHAEELESANGVRLAVIDQYSNQPLLLASEGLGSFPWRESGGEFTTGADTRLVRVGMARSPQLGRIRGKVWLDDLAIEKR